MSVHALILCHQLNPGLKDLLGCLSTSGLPMSIHLDAKCSRSGIDQFIEGLDAPQNVTMLENRKACAWGEFSLVSATLDLLRSALARDAEASHFILLSGNCFPVKSLKTFQAYLQQNPGRDFIETYPLSGNHKWTKGGFEKQRFDYRHFFNFQSHKRLFGLSWKAQRLLGIKQKTPKGLELSLGAQWWCLSRETAEAILGVLETRPEIEKYFKHTWIPDESFFQTLVRMVAKPENIESRSLTFYHFNHAGLPIVLHDGAISAVEEERAFFARKVSDGATGFRTHFNKIALGRKSKIPAGVDGEKGKALTLQRKAGSSFWPGTAPVGDESGLRYDLLRANTSPYGIFFGVFSEELMKLFAKRPESKSFRLYGRLFAKEGFYGRLDGEADALLERVYSTRALRLFRPLDVLHYVINQGSRPALICISPFEDVNLQNQLRGDPHAEVFSCDEILAPHLDMQKLEDHFFASHAELEKSPFLSAHFKSVLQQGLSSALAPENNVRKNARTDLAEVQNFFAKLDNVKVKKLAANLTKAVDTAPVFSQIEYELFERKPGPAKNQVI